MFLHEIRAALGAELGSTARPYSNDAEVMASLAELISAGDITTLGPAYLINKK